jgi:hypothetical protein
MSIFQKATNDLFRLRELYRENGIENLRLSNEMSKNYQTAIVTVVLAELAFLGTIGFHGKADILIASSATLLIIALVIFLIGVGVQQMAVQNEAKISFGLASKVDKHIKTNKTQFVDELPAELQHTENTAWVNAKLGTKFLRVGYSLIVVASVLIVIIIWRLALV